ncbi:hypothetical protein D3C87_2064180 [compost metagenome]
MDGRNAAQVRETEVQWFAGSVHNRLDRDARTARVRNDANGVLEIKCAGLLGDIACWKILAQKTLKIGAFRFADDLA